MRNEGVLQNAEFHMLEFSCDYFRLLYPLANYVLLLTIIKCPNYPIDVTMSCPLLDHILLFTIVECMIGHLLCQFLCGLHDHGTIGQLSYFLHFSKVAHNLCKAHIENNDT